MPVPGEIIAYRGDYALVYDSDGENGLAMGHVVGPDGRVFPSKYIAAIVGRGYWVPVEETVKSIVVFEPVIKHPGHPNQKIHGRRGGTKAQANIEKLLDKEPITVSTDDAYLLLVNAGGRPRGSTPVDLTNVTIVGHEGELFDAPNLGIPRDDMPQVPSNMKPEFIEAMSRRGQHVERDSVDPMTLRPVQGEIDGGMSGGIMLSVQKNGMQHDDRSRIIISNDGYVLDGHHRWAAMVGLRMGGEPGAERIPVFRMDVSRDEGLRILHEWNDEAGVEGLALGESSTRKSVVVIEPVLKHPGHVDQKVHGRRLGVHTGPRVGMPTREKLDPKLVHEATTMDALPEDLQKRIESGMTALGTSPEELDKNIGATLDRAIAEANPDGGTTNLPAGHDWYDQAHNESLRIADEHGLTPEQSAGMIAATSPQQAWGDNVACVDYMGRAMKENHEVQIDALMDRRITKVKDIDGKKVKVEKTAYEWAVDEVEGNKKDGEKRVMPSPEELRGKHVNDLDPYVAAAVMKGHAQLGYRVEGIGKPGLNKEGVTLKSVDDVTGRPRTVAFTCGTLHMGRAVRIARGESVDETINGHKVRSFFNNIRDPQNEFNDVTVDVHAFSVGMGTKFASGSPEYKFFAGESWSQGKGKPPKHPAVSNATAGSKGLYAGWADSYRRVGASRTPPLTARQVQAITWVQWRKEHPDNARGAHLAADAAGGD